MKNKNEKSKVASATKIHYRILEIGASNPEKGISFNQIVSQLKNEGLISNLDDTEHLLEWFLWSFSHKERECGCKRRKSEDCECKNDDDQCDKHPHDTDCNHFLQKEALIDFAQLEQARIGKENSEQAERESKSAFRIAMAAVGISALSLIPDFYNLMCHSSTSEIKKELSEIKLHILSKSNERESSQYQELDNSLRSMDVQRYSSNEQDSNNLEEVRKVLETSDEIISTYDE